ncbi:MAG: hypothetical protein M3N12_00870 [Verrucomicrobiota bacterium]|nr:hypothetical protein [Verrucomicrobiota bacterium]
MTAVAAWIRHIKDDVDELWMISDSRLSDGRNLDSAPKLFPLLRGDIALCFAGETQVAYPFLQQIYFTSLSFRAARTRGLDLIEYRSHVLRILNDLVSKIETPIKELKTPKCSFLLCGYSWIKKRFFIWKIQFHRELNRFHFDRAGAICGRPHSIMFGGDAGSRLKRETARILTERRGVRWGTNPLNSEPLEALVNLLKNSDEKDSIGGAPQLVKIYQHTNTSIIPLYWPPDQQESIYYLGRQLVGYERIDDWILDLTTMTRHPFRQSD